MPRAKPQLSESAKRAKAAILTQKRQEERRIEHAQLIAEPPKPTHTCITCHPTEAGRSIPALGRQKPPPNPKGAYICYWCGDRTNNPRFGFGTFTRNGECVYEPLCPWCARNLFSGRGLDPEHPPECTWPDWQRKTLKEIGMPVYRVRGVLVMVPKEFDTYTPQKQKAPCTTKSKSATAKPSPTPKSSSSSNKGSTV